MRCISVFLLAIGLVAASETGPAVRQIDLVLESSLPYSPRAERHGRPEHDLHVQLLVQGDGSIAERGWAHLGVTPAMEHPVTVESADWDGQRLTVRGSIAILDQWPERLGGTATFEATVERKGLQLDGMYALEAVALTEGERKTLGRKVFGTSKMPIEPRGRVASGSAASQKQPDVRVLTRVDFTESLTNYIRASGRIDGALPAQSSQSSTGFAPGALLAAAGFSGPVTVAEADVGEPGVRLAAAAAAGTAGADMIAAVLGRLGETRNRQDWFLHGLNLAGLAVAHDQAAAGWEQSQKDQVAQALGKAGGDIAALNTMARDSLFQPDGLLFDLAGAGDPRLGSLRAAAGLAAIALSNHGVTEAGGYATADILGVCTRSVRRFLHRGLGEQGAPIGHSAHDEMLELVVPFVLAWNHVGGEWLAWRSGLEHTGSWLALSDGRQLRSEGSSWLPFALLVADPAERPGLAWYGERKPTQAVDAWQALWFQAADLLAVSPAAPSGPLTRFDQRSGVMVARQGWTEGGDLVTIIESGAGNKRAASAQRSLIMGGVGTEWIQVESHPRGALVWPRHQYANAMHLRPGGGSGSGTAVPTTGAKVERVAAPSRSASLGQKAFSFESKDGNGRRGAIVRGKDAEEVSAKVWQTVGVDYSGNSGAEAVLVLVGGALHMGDRGRVFTFDLGDLPKSAVTISNNRFIIRPPGSDYRFEGFCYFPGVAEISLEQDDRKRNVLQFAISELDEAIDGVFAGSIADNLLDLSRVAELDKDRSDMDFGIDDLELIDPEEEEEKLAAARQVFVKLYRVSTSHKMGDPYRRERVRSQHVVVLFVSEGDPPEVVVGDKNEDHLVTIGDQKVTYWEHFVEFAQDKEAK